MPGAMMATGSTEPLPAVLTLEAPALGLTEGAELRLLRASDTAALMEVVVVGRDGVQRPHGVPDIAVYRGGLTGVPGASAVLFVGQAMSAGWVQYPDGRREPIGSGMLGAEHASGRPPVPFCAADDPIAIRWGEDPPPLWLTTTELLALAGVAFNA
jgi:hypothetical protein